jgi:hypothetical protein
MDVKRITIFGFMIASFKLIKEGGILSEYHLVTAVFLHIKENLE